MSFRAAEVSNRRARIETLTDEVEATNLELQTMPGVLEEATKLQSEPAKLRKAVVKDKANVAVMSGLQKEISVVKEALVELLPAVEKSRDL